MIVGAFVSVPYPASGMDAVLLPLFAQVKTFGQGRRDVLDAKPFRDSARVAQASELLEATHAVPWVHCGQCLFHAQRVPALVAHALSLSAAHP
jgi:hypothetical protein